MLTMHIWNSRFWCVSFVSAMVVPEYIEIIQVIAPVIAFILFILLGILFVINIMRAVKLFMTIKVPR